MAVNKVHRYSPETDDIIIMHPFVKTKNDWINRSPEAIYNIINYPTYIMAGHVKWVLSLIYAKKLYRNDQSYSSKEIFKRIDKIDRKDYTSVRFNNVGDDLYISPKTGLTYTEPWNKP